MNKILHRIAAFTMASILTVCTYSSGRASAQTVLMPPNTINIAYFYKPPAMDAATAVSNFNTIILTNGDQTYRKQLVSSGFASDIPEYFRADAIQNPGSCTASPANNQVAYKVGDFCSISKNHPDWFLLDSSGNRITVTTGGSYYRMDPANAGWKSFFVSRVVENQTQYGWTALFLDNVEGGLGKFYTVKPAKYADNLSYQTAIAGFLKYLDANYSVKYGRPIVGNIVARADDPVWFTYLQYLDGAMQERFAVDWSFTSYLSATKWVKDLDMMEKTQANGKYVVLVAPGNKSDTNRQKFAFASYLLMNKGKAAFRYASKSAYGEVWLYSNYKLKLGNALGARYLQGSVWRRDFANGYVTVDPVYHTATIQVTATTSSTTTLADAPEAATIPTETIETTQTTLPAPVSTNLVYDDKNSAFSYSGSWNNVRDGQSLEGSFKRTKTASSFVTLPFDGQTFTVIYKSAPGFGKLEVYIDGEYIDTIDQATATVQYQNKWSFSGTLTEGPHSLKLVFVGPPATKASLDAVTIP